MKNIYILTLILFISICFGLYVGPHRVDSPYESYQNSPKEILKYENDKHGIQYCKEYSCWYEEGNCELEPKRTTYYDKNGKISSDKSYKYDYDSNNNIINEYYYSDGELYRIYNYKYDFNNNQIERRTLNSNGDLLQKLGEGGTNITKSKYDTNNNLIELLDYRNEDLSIMSTYKYDSLNNMIEEEDGNPDPEYGFTLWKYSYKYDSHNRIIETRNDNVGSRFVSEFKYNYKYDLNDNIVEILYYENGWLSNKTYYIYNKNHHIIEKNKNDIIRKEGKEIELPSNKSVYEYEYY